MMHNLRQYTVPLHRYVALMDLQVISFWLVSLLDTMGELMRIWNLFRRGTRGCFTSF